MANKCGFAEQVTFEQDWLDPPMRWRLSIQSTLRDLAEGRVCGREHRLVLVFAQIAKETANSAKRLAQEKIGGVVCLRRGIAVSTRELKFGIPTAQYAGRCKKVHGRAGDPLLDELQVEDWLAIGDERAIDRDVKTPNQATELISQKKRNSALRSGTSGMRTAAPSRCMPAVHALPRPRDGFNIVS